MNTGGGRQGEAVFKTAVYVWRHQGPEEVRDLVEAAQLLSDLCACVSVCLCGGGVRG